MDDENPYASPASHDESARPPFRPSRIAGWLCWILRGGDWRLRRAKRSGDLILHIHPMFSAFLWMVALGGPIVSPIVALLNPPAPHEWWAPWFIAGICFVAGGLGLIAAERVIFSPDCVRKIGPFWRRRRMRWPDVVSVDFEKNSDIVLVSVNGTRIRITPDLVGVTDMVDVLEYCLPDDVLEDCAIDLDTYRRFVGASKAHRASHNSN